MPDITLCSNSELCPYKDECERATAKPDLYCQSYADFYNEDKECNYKLTKQLCQNTLKNQ